MTAGPVTIQGRTLTFPIPIAAASCFGGVFLCPARAAEAILAPTGLRPLTLAGRSPVVVLAVDYHDDPGNVLGDYNELGLIFLVRTARRSVHGHVHQLPVSQDFTREAGQSLWGFPKWLADISLSTDSSGGEAALHLADGATVVRIRTRTRLALRLPGLRKPRSLQVCQLRDGVTGLIRASVTAKGVRVTAGGTRVVPGEGHPLAGELTALGFPQARALLSFTVERLTAELAPFDSH